MRLWFPALLTAALALSACVATAENGRDWVLDTVDGQPPGWRATLSLAEPGRIAGQAPCNRYSGPLERSETQFKVGALVATRMACPDLAGETAFLEMLSRIETVVETKDLLILSGAGHDMRFVPPTE